MRRLIIPVCVLWSFRRCDVRSSLSVGYGSSGDATSNHPCLRAVVLQEMRRPIIPVCVLLSFRRCDVQSSLSAGCCPSGDATSNHPCLRAVVLQEMRRPIIPVCPPVDLLCRLDPYCPLWSSRYDPSRLGKPVCLQVHQVMAAR